MLLIKPMIWIAYDTDCHELQFPPNAPWPISQGVDQMHSQSTHQDNLNYDLLHQSEQIIMSSEHLMIVLHQNAPSFTQLFELSELKAQSQAKDTVIVKLKEQIKSLRGNGEDSSVKMDMDEIETLNIEIRNIYNDCMSSDNVCVSNAVHVVKSRAKPNKNKPKKVSWKPTGKVFTQIGYTWRPTGRTFTIVGNACPLTRITTTNEVPSRKPIVLDSKSPKPVVKLVYSRKPRKNNNAESVSNTKVVQIVLWYLDSGCSKHMTGDRSQLTNFVSKFLGTVKFGNDQVAKIMGFGDYQIGNVTISRVYYVEGLGHNLFSVGQFCDSNLEVAFRQHTCFIRNLEGKSSKKPHKPKSEDTNQEKLYLLHMDLCGPMRVASVSGKKYILVIVDDYSRFTWVKCLRSKDEAPAFIINFLKMIQTLREYYEKVGISHETYVARSPQQNGVVERRNRTLIEAARTMLIYAKAPLFLWAEAVATACYTQNRSMIRRRHGKTPYELLHDKPPDLSYLHVFGALCYPTNDSENLGKLQPKADIGILLDAPTKKAFRIITDLPDKNETIQVDIDDLTRFQDSFQIPPSVTPFVHLREMTGLLFQPMFDESPNVDVHAPEVMAPIPEAVAPEHAVSNGSPSSTTVDQDAPIPKSQTDEDKEGKAVDSFTYRRLGLPKSTNAVKRSDHAGCQIPLSP
ncbi:retrovirus-related pol polyprotein from transposon TNT 1-94 [Tanacetum coccineum]